MNSVNDLLNKISEFKCIFDGNEIVIPGMLQKENENIILNAKIPLKQYNKLAVNAELVILGKVSGHEITLIGKIDKHPYWSWKDDYYSVLFTPTEIIIGGCFTSIPMVKVITISPTELNYMFPKISFLEPKSDFSEEISNMLNSTFSEPIIANDKYGQIKLSQTFDPHISDYIYQLNIIPRVEYSFNVSTPLNDAVSKIAAARNLFSFFGNGYIPLNDINFITDADKRIYELWLNYKEDVPSVNMPFPIKTSVFKANFQELWNSWLKLYESANPISSLFYEVICNRSTRINGFLNLAQAVEVYSSVDRYQFVKELAEKNGWKKESIIPLKFVYQDLLSIHNDSFKLNKSNIENYAQGLSDIRNYYTHYNIKRYIEPTYDELISAIHIFRFLLLAVVYTYVKIPLDCIIKCKSTISKYFDDDLETILKYSKKMDEKRKRDEIKKQNDKQNKK